MAVKRTVEIVHDYSNSGRSLKNDVKDLILKYARDGWIVHSANTSVATCLTYNQHTYVQWCATIVFEKKTPSRKE